MLTAMTPVQGQGMDNPQPPAYEINNGPTKWEDTPLGKFEAAVLNTPDFLKKSKAANKEAHQAMQDKRTHGTSIPGVNTFRRQ